LYIALNFKGENRVWDLKTVLITGANGFIGHALAVELIQQGFNVICAVRTVFHLQGAKTVIIPDLELPINWPEHLAGVDCVIHTAARVHVMDDDNVKAEDAYYKANILATLNLAQAAAGKGVKRLIFLSSVKVNGENTMPGKLFREDDAPNPQDNYSISKYQAEEGLLTIARQTGMEIVIIRPPLVYGPGVKANFASMMNALQRKWLLPLGSINNKRSFIYLGNLVNLITCCISHPQAENQVFFGSDGYDVSISELLMACAEALGVKARLLPIPQSFLNIGAKLLGKEMLAQRLCGSLQIDINKALHLLGWKPPISMTDGLKATAEYFLHKG
jgi:nucleoside-diphosphate-sugar epimerase